MLHAAATFDMPALELRVISNSTGDRDRQAWDLDLAFARLGAMAGGISSRLD